MRHALWGLLLLAAFGSACASKPELKPGARILELRATPASPTRLAPGTIVKIAAVPVPATEMRWVSGTVKLFRAPTLAFKKDATDGIFKFKTMVPPMVNIPAGNYEVKAWGYTVDGEKLESRMEYVVH